jgi:hypothetical protein
MNFLAGGGEREGGALVHYRTAINHHLGWIPNVGKVLK